MKLFFVIFTLCFGCWVFLNVYTGLTRIELKQKETDARRKMKRERREIRFIIRSSRIKGPGWWDSRGGWIKYATFIFFLNLFVGFADLM